MVTGVSDALLAQLSELIEAQIGLHFPPERWPDLERKIQHAAQTFHFSDVTECIHWLISAPLTKEQIQSLAGHLTVGETYFFREQRSFEALEEYIVPRLLDARRSMGHRLRIWSAACCTGEEPYSIAIALSQAIPDLQSWHVSILATDISRRFLQKAAEGIYGQWSFRAVPAALRERYFHKTADGRFAIHPSLKKMVSFAPLNLAADVYPALSANTQAMDVIFCRNVLIYFTAERARRVIEHLYRTLVNGGWLIVSPVEAAYVLNSPFIPVQLPGVLLFQKEARCSPHPSEEREATLLPPLSLATSHPQVQPDMCLPLSTDVEDAVFPKFPHRKVVRPEDEPPLPLSEEARALCEKSHYAEAVGKLVGLNAALDSPLHSLWEREQAMSLLARVYANQGQLAEAKRWCERALTTDKLNPGLHYLHAIILLEEGNASEAAKSLKRTLYLDHSFVLAHFALGHLARQQAEVKEANKYFDNALALLQAYRSEEVLLDSEGITAGRLVHIISGLIQR